MSEVGLYNREKVPLFPTIPTDDKPGQTKLNLLSMRWEEYKDKILPYDQIDPNIKKRLYDHYFIVCADSNQEFFNYIIKWNCNILFRPDEKDGVCLIFYSPNNGDGKTFATQIPEHLIGERLYVQTEDKRVIGQRFNTLLENKILLTLDDMGKQGKIDMEELKRTLTRVCVVIESKGHNVYVVGDLTHFIASTNILDCVRIPETDRRIAIFRICSTFMQNEDYFNSLAEMLKDPKYIQHAISWFWHYDHQPEIIAVHTRKIPLTEPRKALIGNQENNIKQFFAAIVKKEYPISWDFKTIDEVHYCDEQTLYECYIDYCSNILKQKDSIYKKMNFGAYAKEMLGSPKDKRETELHNHIYHYGVNKKPKAYSFSIKELAEKMKLEMYLQDWEPKVETKEELETKIKEMESYLLIQKMMLEKMNVKTT